ncbi:MAG: hypothetical protein ACJ72N_05455 [Labedaea sp.]
MPVPSRVPTLASAPVATSGLAHSAHAGMCWDSRSFRPARPDRQPNQEFGMDAWDGYRANRDRAAAILGGNRNAS